MIITTVSSFPEGSDELVERGRITVHDDGTYDLEGAMTSLDDVPILMRGENGPYRLTVDQDPALWARNLDRAFRTPHLVPKVLVDDQPGS